MAVVAVFLTVLGCGVFLGGVEGLREASTVAERGRSADGIILEKKKVKGPPQAGTIERIKVRFTMVDGTSHQFWSVGDAKVGDTVRVHYVPGRPETASTRSVASNRFGHGLLVFAGLGLMILIPLLVLTPVWESLRDRRRAMRRRSATK
ncbi:DUF3592 domain-containing protein [Streptomyces sp. TRM49041]|uniref:DUF3592 domain-containing protein n=1 Tax=Streptomyces sp. TRM49041 TaxID=2603216 RepID=UPI0011EE1C94|nr:DUF3592 domain-containing protein [Streptomyces sp. TRM49041]